MFFFTTLGAKIQESKSRTSRVFHDILSQTLNEIIVAQKVFNSVNICFKMHLFYQKYLSFCILLVSPIVSSTAVNFVLHKSFLRMLFTQVIQQRECCLPNVYYTWIMKNGFFHSINFDKHVVTTDVRVVLGLVSPSFLSDAAWAGTEDLSIN